MLNRCILAEVVFVDDGALLPDLLFVRTTATLQICLSGSTLGTLLDGVEKVITLIAELHCDALVLISYPFVLECRNVRSKRTRFQKVVEGSITGCLANLIPFLTVVL